MNWQHFQTHNESPERAFEMMCNQLFELFCKRTYLDKLESFTTVNGSGGDGGVESFVTLINGDVIGVQAKWFLSSISQAQFNQIKSSIVSALKVRPDIKKYIVCVPRDLANKKAGKNGKIVSNTEDSRWKQIKNEAESKCTNLEVELWNETKLLTELQNIDSAGVARYYFEKSEFSNDTIEQSFKLQKSGWLSQKYTPVLHQKGYISREIKKFIGYSSLREDYDRKLDVFINYGNRFISLAKEYITVLNENNEKHKDFILCISDVQEQVVILIKNIQLIKKSLREELKITRALKGARWYLNCHDLLDKLESAKYDDKKYFHVSDVKKSIEALQKNDIRELVNDIIKKQLDTNKLIFFGNPGTGKTHGVANGVEELLLEGIHTPILVQARSIPNKYKWKDIILKTLGLSSVWNNDELWNALETLSYRNEVNFALCSKDDYFRIIPKIVIFVDGVDESHPYDIWIERFREIDAICANHPRIRFCILSRKYAFNDVEYKDELLKNTIYLKDDGDVAVNVMFNSYMKHFKINVGSYQWLKWVIKTPLALRTFCEIYEGSTISEFDKSKATIHKLLEKKIKIIDTEFWKACNQSYSQKDYLLRKALIKIALLFSENMRISRTEMNDALSILASRFGLLSNQIGQLIDFIENYGLTQSYSINSNSILKDPEIYYYIGIQPIFDYLLALIMLEEQIEPKKIKLTDGAVNSEGALQMLSIILLEDYGFLISDNDNVKNELNSNELFNLVCFALSNVSANATEKHVAFIKKFISQNARDLKEIVNEVILPVSRIENHPLGATLLHEFLWSFKKVSKRDLIWSGPSIYGYDYNVVWNSYSTINLDDEKYNLTDEDKSDGIPLVYAWALTTVETLKRASYRKELMKWAMHVPMEFYKLFIKTCNTNDPQMKEDLFSIAMGTVFSVEKSNECIKLFSDWVMKNIFDDHMIIKNNNIAIRYYSRAIIERAFSYGYLTDEMAMKCRPPYKNKENFIPMSKQATSGDRMCGFKPINYDLSRYVLCDPITNKFFTYNDADYNSNEVGISQFFTKEEILKILETKANILSSKSIEILNQTIEEFKEVGNTYLELEYAFENNDYEQGLDYLKKLTKKTKKKRRYNYNKEADEFLQKHSEFLKCKKLLTPDQFILSSAYSYIIAMGWNKKEFHGYPNGGEPGEIIGADVAVFRKHYPATHGSRSSTMSFCEKYIWCARNEIFGYISDRLPYRDYGPKYDNIPDYGLFDDFSNPAQEIYEESNDENMELAEFYKPDEISPCIDGLENTMKDISFWINNAPIPNYEKWIDIQDTKHEELKKGNQSWLSLYSYNVSYENTVGAESVMFISSCIILKKEFSYLLKDLADKHEYIINELDNPEDISSSTETGCYITPKEICWMDWKQECYNKITNATIENGEIVQYYIDKAVESCVANYDGQGDVYYKLPSKIVRNMLNICDGNGQHYVDNSGQLKAICFRTGENWGESQHILCVDKEHLLKELSQKDKMIFWIVRLYREASAKSREKYKKLYDRYDRSWIVWFEDGKLKSQLFIEHSD